MEHTYIIHFLTEQHGNTPLEYECVAKTAQHAVSALDKEYEAFNITQILRVMRVEIEHIDWIAS